VLHASEQERADVQAAREAWRALSPQLEENRRVFLDETWASTHLTRRYGRAPRGQRLVGHTPCGHGKTTTFLAGLRCAGLTAPLVVDGPIEGATFLAYGQQHLAPALRPGDLVVMDNLSAPKVAGVRQAVAAAGATVLYLPPYSPDFNPIDPGAPGFAKLKTLLRTAAQRTVSGLRSAIGELLDRFAPDQCRRYFRHCGYSSTSLCKTV
jgi:transposase